MAGGICLIQCIKKRNLAAHTCSHSLRKVKLGLLCVEFKAILGYMVPGQSTERDPASHNTL